VWATLAGLGCPRRHVPSLDDYFPSLCVALEPPPQLTAAASLPPLVCALATPSDTPSVALVGQSPGFPTLLLPVSHTPTRKPTAMGAAQLRRSKSPPSYGRRRARCTTSSTCSSPQPPLPTPLPPPPPTTPSRSARTPPPPQPRGRRRRGSRASQTCDVLPTLASSTRTQDLKEVAVMREKYGHPTLRPPSSRRLALSCTPSPPRARGRPQRSSSARAEQSRQRAWPRRSASCSCGAS
jgi:hypothetical protein